jgi:hypothetical protein
MDLDRKVGTPQFTLHALDAGFGADDFDEERTHLKNVGGAELDADAAPLAVPFDYFDSRTAHSRFSPSVRVCRYLLNGLIKRPNFTRYGDVLPVKSVYENNDVYRQQRRAMFPLPFFAPGQ